MKTKQSEAKSTRASSGAATPVAVPEISGLADRLSQLHQCAPLLLPAAGVPTCDRERQDFCSYLEETFPELRRLRRRLTQALSHRDQLSRSLKPLVDENHFQLAARGAGEIPADDQPTNQVIDHAMQLMWDLWNADERFHELAEKVNNLEASLENAVPDDYRRTLRWCLRQIERG